MRRGGLFDEAKEFAYVHLSKKEGAFRVDPWESAFRQALCAVSARVVYRTSFVNEASLTREWWAHQDSNLGPPGYEPEALPTEL